MKYLSKDTGLSADDCDALRTALERRDPLLLKWVPGIVSLAIFFGWMLIVGRGTDALERTGGDVFGFLLRGGALGVVAAILLGYGVAITAACIGHMSVRRWLLLRAFRSHLSSPRCLWCSHLLVGLVPEFGSLKCPECGDSSRVFQPDSGGPPASTSLPFEADTVSLTIENGVWILGFTRTRDGTPLEYLLLQTDEEPGPQGTYVEFNGQGNSGYGLVRHVRHTENRVEFEFSRPLAGADGLVVTYPSSATNDDTVARGLRKTVWHAVEGGPA